MTFAAVRNNVHYFLRNLFSAILGMPIYIDPHGDQGRGWTWLRILRVFFRPPLLWQEPPSAYPGWIVPFLWYWAQHAPFRFDPRHPQGPRAQMPFYVFYKYEDALEQWAFYAASRDKTWLLAWWPHWFVESGILARVVCARLWPKGALFLWEHSPVRTVQAMFGSSINNHPEFFSFLRKLQHVGLSSLARPVPATVQWSAETLQWIAAGSIIYAAAWADAHAREPRPAWDYLGDGTQVKVSKFSALLKVSRFDTFFPLANGWNWAKVFSLYGVNVFDHHQDSNLDWTTMDRAWVEAAHICYREGHSVPAQALVEGIDWKLGLYLGQTDWLSWSGLQRISVLCSEPEDVEDVSIAGLV